MTGTMWFMDEPAAQHLAERVRAARVERDWSKEEAARQAGISAITWKRIEDGLRVQEGKLAAALRSLGLDEEGNGDARPDILPPGVEPVGDPNDNLFRVSMSGVFGVQEIIVSGPITDADLLREQAAKLIASIRRDAGEVRESDS